MGCDSPGSPVPSGEFSPEITARSPGCLGFKEQEGHYTRIVS